MCREGLGRIPRDREGERWGVEGGELWRQHEPRHEAGSENAYGRLVMLSLRGVTSDNVERGRWGLKRRWSSECTG